MKDGHDPAKSTERTIDGHGDGIEGFAGGISPDWDIINGESTGI